MLTIEIIPYWLEDISSYLNWLRQRTNPNLLSVLSMYSKFSFMDILEICRSSRNKTLSYGLINKVFYQNYLSFFHRCPMQMCRFVCGVWIIEVTCICSYFVSEVKEAKFTIALTSKPHIG